MPGSSEQFCDEPTALFLQDTTCEGNGDLLGRVWGNPSRAVLFPKRSQREW
jgi:hypothetical protein